MRGPALPQQGQGPVGKGGVPVRPGGGAPIGRGVFTPPGARGGLPPSVTLRLPPNLRTGLAMFSPGSVIHGKVTGREGGSVMLRLGEHNLKAQSKVPLQVGQTVTFQVQGQNKGQLHLQLLKSPFTKMSSADVSQTLTQLKVPNNEGNVNLAKVMVEHKIPLTKENFTFLKSVLAQPAQPGANGQPPSMTSRVSATHFLQSSNLPTTPQNVSTMANFLTTNPQIGGQMFALNTEFRRMTKVQAGDSTAIIESMTGVQSALGEYILDPKRRKESGTKKPGKKLYDMAKQTGIEGNLASTYGGGEDAYDLLEMLRQLRGQMQGKNDAETAKLLALLKGLEENIEAHKLINQARSESALGYYYLQVPLRLENDDMAEIWVSYYNEEDGSRVVDPEDTVIEFLINTENLGEIYLTMELRAGKVHVDLGTPDEAVREFAARFLPALSGRLSQLGFAPGRVGATYRPFSGGRRLVEHEDFEDLERCSVQA